MTVAEFIEWLKTQDQGATVEVVVTESLSGWEGGVKAREVPFTPDLSDYTDCRTFVKPDDPYYNDRTLLLGENEG